MIIRVNVVLSLTLKMTKAPVVKTSVTINNHSPIYGLRSPRRSCFTYLQINFSLNVLTICLLYMYTLKLIPNYFVKLCKLEI